MVIAFSFFFKWGIILYHVQKENWQESDSVRLKEPYVSFTLLVESVYADIYINEHWMPIVHSCMPTLHVFIMFYRCMNNRT